MPTKKELKKEVETLRSNLAESLPAQQADSSAATAAESPTWIQQFLTVQSESQRLMQQLSGQLVQREATTESHFEKVKFQVTQPEKWISCAFQRPILKHLPF